MTHPSPAQLHQIARDERARRRAAWERSGKAASDIARNDDIIWSNIEQMTGLAAGDPICCARQPDFYYDPTRIVMARNIYATATKADASLDMSRDANRAMVANLFRLYRWVRPVGWHALMDKEEGRAAA